MRKRIGIVARRRKNQEKGPTLLERIQPRSLEIFFDFIFDFGNGIVGGRGAVDWLPLLVDDKLGEVPLDRVDQDAGLLVLQVLPKRVGIVPVDIDLGEHVKGDVVLLRKSLQG